MLLIDASLTANEVLRAFHQDEPYLFLGSAFTTIAVVAISFCAIRKRFDPLLVWLAVFAHLYGQRLWMNAAVLRLTVPPSEFFERLRVVADYLVPIPAFLFFQSAGFFGRWGRQLTTGLIVIYSGLVIGTVVFGNLPVFRIINNSGVIAAMLGMVLLLLLKREMRGPDSLMVRIGLLAMATTSILDNTVRNMKVEPYGFAILLASLGYVAARRTLKRDEELGEIQKELELARTIQLSLLPAAFPCAEAFRVAACYIPMNSVAGDFYDFLIAEEKRAGLLIADVSGHGVPAALIASMVKMAAISQRAVGDHPGRLLTDMNRTLCGNTQGQYVTAAYAYLDAEANELRYAAAGHPAMLLLRGGLVSEIAENGLLLAASDAVDYAERSLPLERGDRLVLYTDGVLEARNAKGEMFGEASLNRAIVESSGISPAEAAETVVERVRTWARFQEDDLTVVICDYA